MYTSTFKAIFILLICCGSAWGQSRFTPTAFRTGIDLTGVGYTMFRSNHSQYELNSDLEFGKHFLVLDLGTAERAYQNDFAYNYNGQYFRMGVDINLLDGDPDNNVIFAGLRYARSFYSEKISYALEDEVFGDQFFNLENSSLNGRWFEVVGGMKIRVWGQLFLGYTLRFKFIKKTSGTTEFTSYEMPGFGKVANNSAVGFNYHVFYRIPFK